MSDECQALECGCSQGVFSEIVYGVEEVRDYLADETGIPFVIENPEQSGFQTIDGEYLELN